LLDEDLLRFCRLPNREDRSIMTVAMAQPHRDRRSVGARAESKPAYQLMPFNQYRFDDCMAYLAAKHGDELNTYELMKLHVMIDVYHTLERGKPVIGGSFWPFTNGPVARSAASRVSSWRKGYEVLGKQPDGFQLRSDAGDRLLVKPTAVPEEDDFSRSEIEAMGRAWDEVMDTLKKGFAASQEFFHGGGFIGKAWLKARNSGLALDWNDIIDEYDAAFHKNHSHIKALLRY